MLSVFCSILLLRLCYTSTYEWIWLKGDRLQNTPAKFGQTGTPSNEVLPGARTEMNYCFDQKRDTLVIFGGTGVATTSDIGTLNDVWSYNVASNQFTHHFGGQSIYQSGFFTDRGVFSSESFPRGRSDSNVLCSLDEDSIYLYGPTFTVPDIEPVPGNDLWQFNLTSRMWKWISGPAQEDFGPDAPQVGSALFKSAKNENNKLWYIFEGWDEIKQGPMMKLWTFNSSNETWTSEDTSIGASGREASYLTTLEIFPDENQMFIFGGEIFGDGFSNISSQLWSFDLTSKVWTRSFKTFENDILGSYENLKIISFEQHPGARYYHASASDSENGLIFVFGGIGYGGGAKGKKGLLSDMWVYDLTYNVWVWLSGSKELNQRNVFGTKGVASQSTKPGSRANLVGFFSKSKNSFIVFGGKFNQDGTLLENQLWSFEMPKNLILDLNSTIKSETLAMTSMSARRSNTNPGLSDNEETVDNTRLIIIVAVSVVLIVGTGLAFYMFNAKRSKAQLNESKRKLKVQGVSTTDTSTNYTATQREKTNIDEMTLFTKNVGISKPGFAELSRDEYVMLELIAKGGGGQVFIGDACSEKTSAYGKKVIIKFIGKSYYFLSELQRKAFDQEVAVMIALKECPNIAKIIGYSYVPCVMVMKLYKDGSLKDWVSKKIMVRNEKFYLCFDIAFGIYQLHRREIAHCDLKPANVLIDAENGFLRAYITDFGIAQVLSSTSLAAKSFKLANLRGLSIHYAAPEAFRRFRNKTEETPGVLKAGDIFSFAMIIYELMSNNSPWT